MNMTRRAASLLMAMSASLGACGGDDGDSAVAGTASPEWCGLYRDVQIRFKALQSPQPEDIEQQRTEEVRALVDELAGTAPSSMQDDMAVSATLSKQLLDAFVTSGYSGDVWVDPTSYLTESEVERGNQAGEHLDDFVDRACSSV